MIKRFTGWHMTVILVAFFGVVIGVNILMASYATSTFGGTVVDNSYVASQNYNRWLAEARSQNAYGWHEAIGREDGRIVLDLSGPDGAVDGARVTAVAEHPLGLAEPHELVLTGEGNGRYRATAAIPAGRWLVRVEIRRGDRIKRIRVDLS